MRARTASIVLALASLAGGCGADPTTSPDLGVGSSDQGVGLTITVAGRARPLDAYYSFFVEPLADDRPPGVYLVVTAVDPVFDCAHPSGGIDALSFLFASRIAGAHTTTVQARRGPDLDALVAGSGNATIDIVDDQLGGYDLDGGTVSAGAGRVAGSMRFSGGSVVVEGAFDAPHCAALDFIVPG